MRALNSRRLRSTSNLCLVSRTFLGFLLLLCVLHDTRARSVPQNDDGAVDQVHGKISESVEVSESNLDEIGADKVAANAHQVRRTDEDKRDGERIESSDGKANLQEEIFVEKPEKIKIETVSNDGSVAKKRRRNDAILPVKPVVQDGKDLIVQDVEEKDDGIRRFDAHVGTDDTEGLGQQKVSDDIVEHIPELQIDIVENQKHLINIKQEGEARPEEKRQQAINFREKLKDVPSLKQVETIVLDKEAVVDLNQQQVGNSDEMKEELRNDLRSLELADTSKSENNQKDDIADGISNQEETDGKDLDLNREHRHLAGISGKSKYKSSTVYLNAEDGKLPGREQESIVDGQIKKLISIRDDVLESAGDAAAKHPEKLDRDFYHSEKSTGIDVVAVDKNEELRNRRSNDRKDTSIHNGNSHQFPEEATETTPNRFQKWKDQAILLQEQIRNRTFLQYLREQAIEVLPDIPKFTEKQLLETLKNIWLSRKSSSNETHSAILNATELNKNQLEIIKCAEQLVETRQRQTFMQNMSDCIRGLSVLNCMRIFVWPVVLENIPESVRQTFNNLPIEINLIDLFQGIRAKSARSQSNLHHFRLLTPEFVVSNILKNALESKITYDQAPTFIDPKNETLRTLLTVGQFEILQMAEKLLPGEVRREYSDRMFSCVRRFEYFSCVKYFAWPMIKQYYPALPTFPNYQTWYPSIALYPQYPIVPFPSFVGSTVELPEVIEADATRMRNPKPEAVIVNILQNTLKEHAKVPPPSTTFDADSYVALIPPEQLLSIHMAEQLLPVSYRPGFVQKTVKCIQEFNYLTCIKYSTWPTVKQFNPSLPDLSGWIPNWQFPDIFGYLPEFQLPSFPDISSFIPSILGGGGGETQPTTQRPAEPPIQTPSRIGSTPSELTAGAPTILFRRNEGSSKLSNELENRVTEILTRVHNSLKVISDNSPLIVNGDVIILTTITEKQTNILRLAESIVPPSARATLIRQVSACLQTNNDFSDCTKHIIWPTLARYISNFPEFPHSSATQQSLKSKDQHITLKEKSTLHQSVAESEERIKPQTVVNPNIKIFSRMPIHTTSRTKFPQSNGPVISVTGTRFVPIFTEHPESVILNILKSIQLSSPNVHSDGVTKVTQTQLFSDLLNDQQESIIRITEGLLPDATRPSFINRMLECVSEGNFLICSRDVLWPTLSEFYPRLPSFPNFGYPQGTSNNFISSNSPYNLTDTSPFSETDVKIGQHGDATVTITDTRFYPVFTEHPEGVILNILRAVQHSTPGVLNSKISEKSPEITTYFTEQQATIIQIEESLLPESVRAVFVDRMVTCVRESTFLDCTRDIAWPTIAQFFPRLPNFPNFGNYQNLPRAKVDLSSILLPSAYSENHTQNEKNQDTVKSVKENIEDKIEDVLKEILSTKAVSRLEYSYLDVNNPVISALLTTRESNIIRLTERAIPDPFRRTYVTNMVECVKTNNFMSCTQHVSWPILKQFAPSLPNFEELLGQFPGISQIPDLVGQIPSFPGIGNFPFAEFPSIPQFPSQITQIPGAIQGGIAQFPGLGELPGLGDINFPQFSVLSNIPRETKIQRQIARSRVPHLEQTNQISGVLTAANTPSVDTAILGYPGQPSGIFIDISKEKIHLSDVNQQHEQVAKSVSSDLQSKKHEIKRRSTDQLLNSYYDTDAEIDWTSGTVPTTFPNITESEFLELLINITKSKKSLEKEPSEPKEYFVDTLNSTIRDSLTADQYQILKTVQDLNEYTANRGFWSQVYRCITSLSFIRCMGIFVWPLITNTVPSVIGLPSLPTIPGLGILGRSTEHEVEQFFGMSTSDLEKELLSRKESDEHTLLNWYEKLMEDKFQINVGFLKVKGYGNGEVGISFSGYREGRATKIKDNKNLPSILTIISDIMEEVLDQRPDSEKFRKEKRERSLEDMQESDFQLLKESDEYVDTKRSMNDDQIITMFLNKIKANASDFTNGDITQFLNTEEAHNAFGVLFGTRLNDKFASRLKAFAEEQLKKEKSESHTKESSTEELTVIPLKTEVSYELEKEIVENQEANKRVKNGPKSLLDKYSDEFTKSIPRSIERTDNNLEDENKIKDAEAPVDKDTRSELRIRLPRLQDDIVCRKIKSTAINLGRALKTKMTNLIPGIGLIISFLIQTALAHARAAASISGIISNMALGSAVFGMIRQNLFGSDNEPKIKYVYDNDKTGPGITWPQQPGPYYHAE